MDGLIVVCGYGCELSKHLKMYLDEVKKFAEQHPEASILLTGGMTNRRSHPNIAEAEVMADYLLQNGLGSQRLLLDLEAIDTASNMEATAKITRSDLWLGASNVWIFCESNHNLKVLLLSRLIIGWFATIKPVEFNRQWSDKLKQYFIATPLAVLACKFSFFQRLLRRQREKIINQS